jgi:UDP-N-acetylmuramoyl-tripeptide--D-alanyl-D-alanine ligase
VKLGIVEVGWFNKNKDKYLNKPFILVKDTIKALGEIARNHKRKFDLPVLCVGGSNGKTTTKDLISAVLSKKYNVLKTEGNFNNHIGLPLTLLNLNENHNFCVLEVGSNHFGEIKYLCEIAEPGFGIITNIGKEHLEFFKDIKGVAKEEFELFDYLASVKNNTIIFANLDDVHIKKYVEKKKIKRFVRYSYNHKTEIKGEFLKFTDSFEPVLKISYKGKSFDTKVSTFGKHSIFNGLAAAAIGLYFGVSNNSIKTTLSEYKPAGSKRMEVIKKKKKIFINDTYNSNPDSVRLGLETLKEFAACNNKHIVLGDMLELGENSTKEHFEIGVLIKKMKFNNLYTYGKESYNTFLGAKGVENNYYFNEKEDLSGFLNKVINPNDVIYIKGSRGMKMEDVLNDILNQIKIF